MHSIDISNKIDRRVGHIYEITGIESNVIATLPYDDENNKSIQTRLERDKMMGSNQTFVCSVICAMRVFICVTYRHGSGLQAKTVYLFGCGCALTLSKEEKQHHQTVYCVNAANCEF